MVNFLDIIKNSNSWSDIYLELKVFNAEQDRSAGKLFEEFCKLYYLIEPTVCYEYKHVWLFPEIPLKVRRKLNLTTIDHGIDLVLEDYEGKYSAIQCKFRNNQNAILSWSKDKITNIFAEGDKADYFIIFTNASGLDKHTLTKKQNKLKLISLGDLLEIDHSTIMNMKKHLLGKEKLLVQEKKPRDYQKRAIDAVINGFEKADRGQLILPCGAGKTLISLWIQQSMAVKRTIVLVPSLALLRQIKKEWTANGQKLPYLCVCSEKDIDSGQDNIITHTYEISGNVSTDSVDIKQFLENHKQLIIYSTYQSLDVIRKAVKPLKFKFDLAICDEAHKTAGSKLSTFSIIHDDSKIPVIKRLYMTATPRIISKAVKSKLGEEDLQYLCDMSDPNIFGNELFRMGFKDAIDKKILVDYQIVAIGVSDKELEKAIKQRKYVGNNFTIDEVANNYALEKFMNKYKAKHSITFHSSVKKAKNFKERHQEIYQKVDAYHVNGAMTTNYRNTYMKEFESSQKSIMTNARCLTEGIDIPAIDVVYFCDPKNSKIDIVQAAGRALRRADEQGKIFGYIVVPIYHSEKSKLENIVKDGPFKNLIEIVKAMASQDERLVDEIRNIKIGTGERASGSQHISINYGINLITMEGFQIKLEKSLFDQIIDKSPIPWRDFENARKFVHSLNLKNQAEWKSYSKSKNKPADIPSNPNREYKNNGWKSMGDWLGNYTISPKDRIYRNYEQAKLYVQSLKISNAKEWAKYVKSNKLPNDIPFSPQVVYKNKGWTSWGNWLGTNKISTNRMFFKPFKEARLFAHSLKLNSSVEWEVYSKSSKKPPDIPADPYQTYKNKGWKGWGDWLGTGVISNKDKIFRLFEDARSFVRSLKLNGKDAWHNYCANGNKPNDIPSNPDKCYKDCGWESWGNWLGTNSIGPSRLVFLSFEKARIYVHSLKLRSYEDWKSYCISGNKLNNIPSHPDGTYKNKGWVSWGDWLGTDSVASVKRQFDLSPI